MSDGKINRSSVQVLKFAFGYVLAFRGRPEMMLIARAF